MWNTGAYGYLFDYFLWAILTASVVVHTWCLFRIWPPARRPRLRLVVGNAAIALSLLAGVAFAAETYLRFVSTATDVLGATLTCKRWKLAYATLNSLYCRDREWAEHKPPGTYRIAFVGDSFTYGWGIDDPRDRFTNLLQARFTAESPQPVEVMNVAWAGWDTGDQLAFVRDHLGPYDVDEIVLCYLPNDLERLIPTPADCDPRTAPETYYFDVRSSFLLDWIFHRVIVPRLLQKYRYLDWLADGYADPQVLRRQTAVIAELTSLCRERGIKLRVVLFPFILGESERYDAVAVHARVAEALAQNDVPVLDLLPVVRKHDPRRLILGRHDPHPNEDAHRLFAAEIWRAFYSAGASEPGP